MDPKDIVYHICGLYVKDNRRWLGESNTKRILGWIRSRSLKHLASCGDLSDAFSTCLAAELDRSLSSSEEIHLCRATRQIAAFFKKNTVFVVDDRCKTSALASFNEAEELCRTTNIRLDRWYAKRSLNRTDLGFHISKAESYIRRVLGDHKEFLDLVPELGRITAGASSSLSRKNALPPLKISLKTPCTSSALPYVKALYSHFGYCNNRPLVRESNRIEFVPKNWKTHRTIACENEGNVFLQLAFDTYAKRRLRRVGIDLFDQSRNQDLSREASIDGSLATIDLSAASDTVSFLAVQWLFPTEWFDYLNSARSTFGKLENSLIKYEKFSSMGNGSTFAIESLIFSAFCFAVGSKRFSVYGDDIIIETELLEPLTELLSFFGFTINREKSFSTGSFRESCGTDWFAGHLVTPFYLRNVDKRKAINCHNVNGLLGICLPRGDLWKFLLRMTIDQDLPLVPFNEDSMSGIYISAHGAYRLKLIRSRNYVLQFRSYKRATRKVVIDDSRSLFLWHLDQGAVRTEIESVNNPHVVNDRGQRSRYAIAEHKYVRSWRGWFPPTVTTPLHIYMFEEDYLSITG